MITASLEIYISTEWIDITDYTLNLSDFYQLFQNYDTNIREVDLTATLSSTILDTYSANIVMDARLRVKQDSKVIFVGYIENLIIDNYNKYEIEVKLFNMISKLNTQAFSQTYQANVEQNITLTQLPCTFPSGDTLQYETYQGNDLMEYIFEYLTGYELDANGSMTQTNIALLSEALWNMGSSSVSADHERRNNNDIATWKDFFDYMMISTLYFFWDIDTESYYITICEANPTVSNIYPAPIASLTYGYDEEDNIDLRKQVIVSYTYADTANYYFNLNASTSDSITVLNGSAWDASFTNPITMNDPKHIISVYNGLPVTKTGGALANRRFNSKYKTKKYLTSYLNNFLNGDGKFCSNITEIQAKFIDGRYFTEITLGEEI